MSYKQKIFNLLEANKDVKGSDFDDRAKQVYNEMKKYYKAGFKQFRWIHNSKENPRLYHIRKNGRIYNIIDVIKKRIEFPGWASHCKCSYELIKPKKD